MKQRKKLLAAFMALVLTCGVCFAATGAATLTAQADTTSNGGIVTTKDSLTFPLGSEVPFNGTGYLSPMIANEDVYHFPQTNNVTFAPGARSDWHTHGGMVILVTGGVGYYQEEGKTAQIIRQGDVLEIAPGVKHWHGAAPDSWFSQMVIYDSQDDWLAAFMMSSILLNPQLILYSMALGRTALVIRIASSFLCGTAAGLLIRAFYHQKGFFNFSGFSAPQSRDTDPDLLLRFLKNLGRNIKATGGWFLVGVVLSVLFQRYVPSDVVAGLFGDNRGFGVLMAATIGVPLYACGGGTIPLLQTWLADGMSMGSAAAFMITGPATKITNLGAVKIVLGVKRFALYLAFIILFALVTGWIIDILI